LNLNQITLPVSNMIEAVSFYQALGFLQIVDSAHYARFESIDGDATFSLSLEEGELNNGAVIYFETEKLDQVCKDLESKGIVFSQQPTDMTYLWREAILYDPSGNKIKLYWAGENRLNPPWRVQSSA
jgi:predicted enzyme related to lactoylglutathione lyase